MIFYDSVNKQGIVDETWWLTFGDSNDHSTDYPLADVARNANHWYDKVVTKILQADARMEWDDINKTDLPIANISLVNGQQDYGISGATYLKISRVDIKDAQGNSSQLIQFNQNDVRGTALATFQGTNGTPLYYLPRGNSVFLYPAPNYNYTGGLRVFYQRNVDYFTAADTTKKPGFAEMFHSILSYGAALDYCVNEGMMNKVAIYRDVVLGTPRPRGASTFGLMGDLETFYSERNQDRISLGLHKNDYGESALQRGRVTRNPDGFFI